EARNVSTDGVDISVVAGDEEVTFVAYDFGGQQVFYPTHQFFLTSNALYVVVFSLAALDHGRVEYWLRNIRSRTGNQGCPTVLVGTHADEVRGRERDEEWRREVVASLWRLRDAGF